MQHSFSITLSPFHLVLPMGELTGEYRVTDKIAVAAILGVGQVKTKTVTVSGTREDSFFAIDAGAQFRYYPVGNFIHGMQLGAEILFVYVNLNETDSTSASGTGLAIGPFVGYKIATNIGFTFDAQLGFDYLAVQGTASDSGISVTESDSRFGLLLNLNVGWSF
ncbi:MAG: hypothetical protein JRF33_04485 [Deltaproteobacteria bacterium]|nr:hypothetical protein [Deltaproteobacteria bacterium]